MPCKRDSPKSLTRAKTVNAKRKEQKTCTKKVSQDSNEEQAKKN